jgi:hypothetical protein
MVSILFDLLSSEKVALPLRRDEKRFLQNCPQKVSKKRNFALISKIYRSLEF